MQNKRKIINDPVHGFVTIPSELLYDIIQHPYMQRLNKIRQLGLSYMVYPGAQHTRFLHSLGAMHLMQEAILQLKSKGQIITEEESEGVLAAILLHDCGHAPFSHVLEHLFSSGISHEDISLEMMKQINRKMNGKLDLCIQIFQNKYPKKFLHQLVSSQLDMDRLDYLMRDSFFTGVVEGVVGTDRIIKMLNVNDDQLCIEAKGIYSIEKFLIARRIMYWQVYYHKTSVAAERVLINLIKRAIYLKRNNCDLPAPKWFEYFLRNTVTKANFENNGEALKNYANFDDSDILSVIKLWIDYPDKILQLLSKAITYRHLFKVRIGTEPLKESEKEEILNKYSTVLNITKNEAEYLFSEVSVSTNTYSHKNDNCPINILYKDGTIKDIAEASEILNISMLSKKEKKYYFCYYKI